MSRVEAFANSLNSDSLRPNLNVISEVPDDGLELIMNNKRRPPSEVASLSSQTDFNQPNNTRIVSDSDSDSTDSSSDDSLNLNDDNMNNNMNNVPSFQQTYQARPTEEEINNKKRDLLYQFDRLEKKGVKLPRKYNITSDLQEMQSDYDRIIHDRSADASIKFQRKVLVATVTGIEFMNTKFDPINAKLDGWSENVHENVDDYDDIFEELHQKYKGDSKMAPELRLMMSLAGSAFMIIIK
jgi:hypothetical protein